MSDSIKSVGFRAVKWSMFTTAARFALQLVSQVVLARTLGPEIFGLFGLGMVVLNLVTFLFSFGFAWGLLQKKEVTSSDIRFAFTWQIICGFLATFLLYVLSGQIAQYFNEPRVELVVQYLSFTCLLGSATATSNCLLQRNLNYKAIGLISLCTYAVGYLMVGIPLAIIGFGATSLIAAWLIQAVLTMLASFYIQPHSLKPLLFYSGMSSAMKTGGLVFLTNIINWWLNNLDRLVLGRFQNSTALGLYNVGYNLATLPNSILLSSLQPTILAAAAKMKFDNLRLRQAYLSMSAASFVIGIPAFFVAASVAQPLVRTLYGQMWIEAGTIFAILLIGMPSTVVWAISTPILWSTGRQSFEFKRQLPILILAFPLLGLSAMYGPIALAASVSFISFVRMVIIAKAAQYATEISNWDYWSHALRGLLLGILLSSFSFIAQKIVVISIGDYPILNVAIGIFSGIFWGAIVIIFKPMLLGKTTLITLDDSFPVFKRFRFV